MPTGLSDRQDDMEGNILKTTSIRNRLRVSFLALAICPLLLLSMVLSWQGYSIQKQQAIDHQREVSERAANQIKHYIYSLEDELHLSIVINNIMNQDRNRQFRILSGIRSYDDVYHKDVFDELILLDGTGKELLRISRTKAYTGKDLGERSGAEEFVAPAKSGKVYYSPVWFDKMTGEPFVTMGMPIIEVRDGSVEGVVVAEIRLKDIWSFIEGIHIGETGNVYIVDHKGMVVAHKDPSIVLKGTHFQLPDRPGIHKGLGGTRVVMAVTSAKLGDQTLYIVTERSVSEALHLTIRIMTIIALLLLIALSGAVALGLLVTRKIIKPIETLSRTAQSIASGDITKKAEVIGNDELGGLAASFNVMSGQLISTIETLWDTVNKLRESEARINAILNAFEGYIYVCSKDYRLEFMNENLKKLIGHDATGEVCYEALKDIEMCATKEIFRNETEKREVRNSKDNRWYYVINTPLRHADGTISKQAMIMDVTERKEAEIKLSKERDFVSALIDSLPGIFYLFDDEGKLLRWNKNAEEILGYSPEEIISRTAVDFFAGRDREYIHGKIQEVFTKGRSTAEAHMLTKDGREIPFLLPGLRYEIDGRQCLIGLGLDISERMNAEEKLRESHRRLLTVLDSLDSLVYVADMITHEILFINKYMRDLFGDIEGRICWQAIQNGQTGPCDFCTNYRLLDDGGKPSGVYTWEFQNTINGRWYYIHDRAIRWANGQMVRIEIATDITEHKKMEKELLNAKKMESIAVLAAGIAHEINNPLANASLNVQILRNRLEDNILDRDILRKLEAVDRNINTASTIARELLEFSRQKEAEFAPVDINEIIEDVLMFMEHKIKNVAIHQDLKATHLVYGDTIKLEQVFINVLNNAVEAMPDGGEIAVSSSEINDMVEVRVSDTGIGIPEENLSKIFDPFFTTKGIGVGTGLGLSICYGIINQHNGSIDISSLDGKGTIVVIRLPAAGDL